MSQLLFELGCEELPASAVQRSLEQLKDAIEKRLTEAHLEFEMAKLGCTPRRLIVALDGLPASQPDLQKDVRGPSLKAAYGPDGQATKALEGFLRGQGATLHQVVTAGDYVSVTVHTKGRPTAEVLAEILPDAVRSLTFEKTMRWGSGRMRFARPIRWLVALFDGAVVPFDIEGVPSGNLSRGHRFDFPEPFAVIDFDHLITELRARRVEPDAAIRRAKILSQTLSVASGKPDLQDSLVDENAFLTEWPTCHEGSFQESFLELPDPVVVTAMVKHERFFAVRGEGGKLMNKFVSVRNSGDEPTVRAGNEWVLNARLNDAKFFFDEDKRLRLDDFLAKTEKMVFQDGLGTVRQRADRLAALAAFIAESTDGSSEEIDWARLAGLYAKADLSTGLVGELASLQGVVGGIYAGREGLPDAVCRAVSVQYDFSKIVSPTNAGARTAMRLLLADQIDKLAGFVGTGIEPSGSSDPFALRRAATLIIEATWSWDKVENLLPCFTMAARLYREQGLQVTEDIHSKISEIFRGRFESILSEEPHDILAAAISGMDPLQPRVLTDRLEAARLLKGRKDLVQTLSRPVNIAISAEQKGQSLISGNLSKLGSAEGERLAEAVHALLISLTTSPGTPAAKVEGLASLQAETNAFFDSTMIMTPEDEVRQARLTLVGQVRDAVLAVCDITQLTFESGS